MLASSWLVASSSDVPGSCSHPTAPYISCTRLQLTDAREQGFGEVTTASTTASSRSAATMTLESAEPTKVGTAVVGNPPGRVLVAPGGESSQRSHGMEAAACFPDRLLKQQVNATARSICVVGLATARMAIRRVEASERGSLPDAVVVWPSSAPSAGQYSQ